MENNNYETTEPIAAEEMQPQDMPRPKSSVTPWAILGGAGFQAVARAVEQIAVPQGQAQPQRQSGGCGVSVMRP